MLEIRPCLDKSTIVNYCRKIHKIIDASYYLYLGTDKEKTVGAALFQVCSTYVQVLLYEAENLDDMFLFDGILRAGLKYANSHGLDTGYIPEEFRQEHWGKFRKLNYPAAARFDINNLFNKYKNCISNF